MFFVIYYLYVVHYLHRFYFFCFSTYEQPCELLKNVTCPPELKEYGFSCQCPFAAKEYNLDKVNIKVPSIKIPEALANVRFQCFFSSVQYIKYSRVHSLIWSVNRRMYWPDIKLWYCVFNIGFHFDFIAWKSFKGNEHRIYIL